ncbi:Uncharacterized protein OBRU01_22397 [Operophtera brumata]|uniref:Uncharacterized protein n=1 Tax=Operophtera brumata TaxID=104452 RepID=A0A0L7KRN9_OPEBR|nr:Uncharacterized protein OBRU01_22397 [Operophtera brumata]
MAQLWFEHADGSVEGDSCLFDYSGIVNWVQENLGTLSAIATGIWAPLASNVSLLAGSVGAFTSLLLCGGGAIINFIINLYPEWSCNNDVPIEIVYTCTRNNDHIIHLKDYYTDQITSLTVQNCRDLRVVLDCPILQRTSHLQKFTIKNSDRLEFVSLSSSSLLQTPPEVTIENVKEVVSLPEKIFKSPTSNTERKCLGTNSLRKIRIANTHINIVKTRAFHNVTDIKSIEFENVTITNIQSQAIEAIMNSDSAVFKMIDSKIDNIEVKGLTVQATSVTLSENNIGDVTSNSLNITSKYLQVTGNRFKQIYANGLAIKSVIADIQRNYINLLKKDALNNVKCSRKTTSKKQFNFSNNKVLNVEPHSLIFDYASCKSVGAAVTYTNNKIDCKCQNIAFLNNANELNTIIMDTANNNTCLSAPCVLPIDVLKLLLESNMCRQEIDLQLMCLLYNDRHASEVTSFEDVTEPAPTFYLIRPANSPNGAAAMTAVNKDDLLRDSNLNMTNRIAIKFVFDSSKDFVETLRGTGTSKKNSTVESKSPPREEYINRCVGPQCRNNAAYDRQKALDFYNSAGRGSVPRAVPSGLARGSGRVASRKADGSYNAAHSSSRPHCFPGRSTIAGGIFYLGPEGAILGPLLLCCIMVVLNLSSAFLRDTPTEERAALHSRVRSEMAVWAPNFAMMGFNDVCEIQ